MTKLALIAMISKMLLLAFVALAVCLLHDTFPPVTLLCCAILASAFCLVGTVYVVAEQVMMAMTKEQRELVPGEIKVPERCVTCGHMVCDHGEHGCTMMVEVGTTKRLRACGCRG